LPKSPSVGWRWPATLALCIFVAGAESVRLGLDVSWDLKSYHFYNPFAFLSGRLGWDIAPAQIQTYISPFLDLPFYFMVSAGVPPRLVSFLMGVPAGIAAFFLLRIATALFTAPLEGRRLWIGLAFTAGVTGSAGHAVIGATMNEWPLAALVLAAVYVLVSSTATHGSPSSRAVAIAGLLAGLAAGLKLSYAVYGLAIVATALCLGPLWERFRRSLAVGGFLLLGFALAYGAWGAILYREFGSPFFPFFNSVFNSPYWEPVSFVDSRFGPQDPLQALFFPFYFGWQGDLVGEVRFRDLRFAVLLALALASLAKYGIQRPRQPGPSGWLVLAVFAIAAYLVWLARFSIYRYLVPLEMLTGLLIVGCVLYLLRPGTTRRWAAVVLVLAVIASTQSGDWGRLDAGASYFEVTPPSVPADSLVIVGTDRPVAYVIPFFRADARFVSPVNNFLDYTQGNLLARAVSEVIARHRGPIYSLEYRGDDGMRSALAHFGLKRDAATCQPLHSNLDTGLIWLCRIERIRP
jgi:hypothetical protein